MRRYLLPLLICFVLASCAEQNNDADNHLESDTDPEINQTEGNSQEDSKDNMTSPASDTAETTVAEVQSAPAPEGFDDMDWTAFEESMTKDFSFVIIISTKSYESAMKRANEASEKLGYPLDLRGLHANKEIGLSFSRDVCENDICGGGLDYPIYIPRSDWGEEKYISIEYSDAFDGFTKGYYIVVVASGEKGAPVVKEALSEAKKFYKDAYAKTCGVYMGCGC